MEHVAIDPQNTTSVRKVGHHLIPMARDFVYLAVMLDWATRRVLAFIERRTLRPNVEQDKTAVSSVAFTAVIPSESLSVC
jgi:hypothetical protein